MGRRELVELGVVTRPHGVRGEVRVHLHHPESTLFFESETLYLLRDAMPVHRVRAESVRLGPKQIPLVAFAEVNDRTAAERLRGTVVAVHEKDLPRLDQGEWYHRDLVGLAVVGPEGRRAGVVEAVKAYPTIDCLQVRSDDGVREVPMAEPWLVEVDLELGEVHVGSLDDLEVEG